MSAPPKGTPSQRRAFHQAGHSVIAHRLGIAFRPVTIVGAHTLLHDWPERFFRRTSFGDLPSRLVEPFAIVCLAGANDEERFSGSYNRARLVLDLYCLDGELSWPTRSPEESNAWRSLVEVRARQAVKDTWSDIEAVAAALSDRKTLTGSGRAGCHRGPRRLRCTTVKKSWA
jgi:hypothetical protein